MDYKKLEELRKEVYTLGKDYYVMQEMLRTGFLKLKNEDLEKIKENIQKLNTINKELNEINTEIKDIPDITPIINEIRKQRIERVKAERIIKKEQKRILLVEKNQKIQENKENKPLITSELDSNLLLKNPPKNKPNIKEFFILFHGFKNTLHILI
jgi:protein subunit release factor A